MAGTKISSGKRSSRPRESYVPIRFPGNPNVYMVLPDDVREFINRYKETLSWPPIKQREEEHDEIYFLCRIYANLKTQDEISQSTVESLYFQFRDCLARMTAEYAAMFGFSVSSVNLNVGGRKTLGKCSVDGNISYNPILIEYGPTVIKEVILHELCHTIFHNHRRMFWTLLENCLADSGLTDIRGYVIPELFNMKKDFYIVNPVTLQYPRIYTGYRKCQKYPDMFRKVRLSQKSKSI